MATNRASFYLYTVREEIDQLVEGLHKAKGTPLPDGLAGLDELELK